jgi:nitroreductase
LSAATGKGEWHGQPRQLSPDHHPWPPIDEVAAASTLDTAEAPDDPGKDTLPPPASPPTAIGAAKIIRQRRSSINMDGETHLSAAAFYVIMDRSLHRTSVAPFDSLCWAPTCDLIMFVHRVDELASGLYFLHRSTVALEDLQAAMKRSFTWEKPANAPAHIGFYHLASGDYREQSQTVSGHQEIAANGAFSVGVLADFRASLESFGANAYRRMHWEAGLIGQLLYLEAEAAGIRGTGLGCFFDEPVHEIFELSGGAYQSIYHFTVGHPCEDDRILDRAPYDHLKGRAHDSIDPGAA